MSDNLLKDYQKLTQYENHIRDSFDMLSTNQVSSIVSQSLDIFDTLELKAFEKFVSISEVQDMFKHNREKLEHIKTKGFSYVYQTPQGSLRPLSKTNILETLAYAKKELVSRKGNVVITKQISKTRAKELISFYRKQTRPTNLPKGSVFEKHIVFMKDENKYLILPFVNNKNEYYSILGDGVYSPTKKVGVIAFRDDDLYRLNQMTLEQAAHRLVDTDLT